MIVQSQSNPPPSLPLDLLHLLERCAPSDPLRRIRFSVGSRDDYRSLARFHYVAGEPATCELVIRARDEREGSTVGVLVVSRPTLRAAWRNLAWPTGGGPGGDKPRYHTGNTLDDATRINAELRVISRVVIDPRWRGIGLASELTRRYLRRPLTPATECIAAMGAVCPFLRSAGMTEYRLPPAPAEARLADALVSVGLDPTRIDARRLAGLGAADRRFLHRELAVWTRRSTRAKRARRESIESDVWSLTAGITNDRIAYATTNPQWRHP